MKTRIGTFSLRCLWPSTYTNFTNQSLKNVEHQPLVGYEPSGCRPSGARFSKVRPEKPFVEPRLACSVKLVFSYIVIKIKIKIKGKVSCLETPLFWRYKENYVTRNAPEKFSVLLRNTRQERDPNTKGCPFAHKFHEKSQLRSFLLKVTWTLKNISKFW